MQSNEALIEHMIARGVLQTPKIIEAFRRVDRRMFIPEDFRDFIYSDRPLPIGNEQTISQPSTVAFMLELLEPKEGQKILDIGSGSGWTTSLLCTIVGKEGSVLGLERVDTLVALGQKHLAQFGFDSQCRIEKAEVRLGRSGERFDRILVSASAGQFPQQLLAQLKRGGVLVIPVQNDIVKITKVDEEKYMKEVYHGFRFVPLIHEEMEK
jgi:protein-L-isoaspartate(D-aspartate) O-methyltransferase